MTGLRNGFAGPEPLRTDVARPLGPGHAPLPNQESPTQHDPASSSGLVGLHESMAGLLAARGQWRQAYHHLRSALDLVSNEGTEVPRVPEQLRHEVARLRREHAEAREQSMRDSLTASYNRRYLDQVLTDLLGDSEGAQKGLALALVDLDWFKNINDTYGHVVGDRALRRVVELLQEGLPGGAFCARYGGDEFVLVLPAIDAATTIAVCETARARVERFNWSQLAAGLRVTISVGINQEFGNANGSSPTAAEQQLLRADDLLYMAKQWGRNAVAYRSGDQVRLAGAAAARRGVPATRTVGY